MKFVEFSFFIASISNFELKEILSLFHCRCYKRKFSFESIFEDYL